MLAPEEQLHIIASGAAQIVPEAALLEKLKRGKPLNIKLGVDPDGSRHPPRAMRCRCASCASSRTSAIA